MKKIKCIVLMCLTMAFFVGCQPGEIRDGTGMICPGKASIEEAVRMIDLQRSNVQPLRASAECTFHYQNDKGKEKKQMVDPVTVRFVPPYRIIFRGDEFGEVGFGANENQFWLRVKPEWDSYWWGTRSQADQCAETMLINPYNVIEALGVVEVTADWQLSHDKGYDILTLFAAGNTLAKRVYVDACDYLVERIEYYDQEGFLKASADLSRYTTGEDGIIVPSVIEATYYRYGIKECFVVIKLKHVGSFFPTEKQRRLLFKRPERDGFEHMYKLNDACEFIEEVNR
ncbi:MAG: hypothetical protein ABFR90_00235 [Planctomycetota bacterium]